MNARLLPGIVAWAFITAAGQGSASDGPPAPAGSGDRASQVRAVFAVKCVQCHGPDVAKPKGKFGYVLDLKRVAGNPKIVVPFQPDESKLWTLVHDDEMPPEDAKAGPLTEAEKEIIHGWIAAGAPASAPPPVAAASPSTPPPAEATTEPPRVSTAKRTLRWLGKLHILVIHFPIAFIMGAAIGELLCAWKRVQLPSPAVRFCVLLGAGGAVCAVALGWLHADMGGYGAISGQLLLVHRWIGTSVGLCAVGMVLLSERDTRRQTRSQGFRILLLIGTLLVMAAGHFGGLMVHGEDFFNW